MGKKLCDLKKLRKKDPAAYGAYVDQPAVICGKCQRTANKKKYVCRPAKLKDGA